MSRSKIADQMIKYLEKKINCENIIKHINENKNHPKEDKLIINEIAVAFEIIQYDDDPEYDKEKIRESDNPDYDNDKKKLSEKDVDKIFAVYDFMTEANYTGFEYFPYLYGVLNCHEGSNSRVYTFYESFDGNLINLIQKIDHPSEWYDIAFQIIMINYYIQIVNAYSYNNGEPQNHLYKKLAKPYYKLYQIDGIEFNINHKYLLVIWNITHIKKITDKMRISSNISLLLEYLEKNTPKIPPSSRIINLFNNIKSNPENTLTILKEYYPISASKNI